MLLLGHRDGKPFGPLDPTHAWRREGKHQVKFDDHTLLPATNAWDAIGHLSSAASDKLIMSGKWADLLPTIPEGENYLFHTDRGGGVPIFGWRRRFWNFLLKLAKDKPSWTLTAQPGPATGPFHWDNRHLSAEELCALQTFPSDYQILGKRSDAQKQVGNAVPSALAELVALKMRARFFAKRSVKMKLQRWCRKNVVASQDLAGGSHCQRNMLPWSEITRRTPALGKVLVLEPQMRI